MVRQGWDTDDGLPVEPAGTFGWPIWVSMVDPSGAATPLELAWLACRPAYAVPIKRTKDKAIVIDKSLLLLVT